MTQRDPDDSDRNENERPAIPNSSSNDPRRRSSLGAQKQDTPATPTPAASSYGSAPAKQPLRPSTNRYSNDANLMPSPSSDMQLDARIDNKPAGLDLDAVDSVPTTPDPDEIRIEDVQDNEQVPTYQPTTIIYSGWPDIQSLQIKGHGQLPNSLLGKSKNPAFSLGNGFRGWDNATSFTEGLRDYQIKADFVAQGPAEKQAQSPQKKFSYSQAAASSSTPQAPISGSPSQAGVSEGNTLPKLEPESMVQSRPHPHAFYNIKTHSWTVITPYPDLNCPSQSSVSGCPGRTTAYPHTSTPAQKSHHYVRLPQQVDPRFILRPSEVHYLHHTGSSTGLGGPTTAPLPNPVDNADMSWVVPASPVDAWWDLYVCSGCRNTMAVSPQDVVPSVLGRELCERFTKVRRNEATEDKDGAMRDAVDYVWKVLRNVLFRGETSAIPPAGATFRRRMGSSDVAVEIFRCLGFTPGVGPKDPPTRILDPPKLLSNKNMLYLGRAFLEISIWSAALHTQYPLPAPAAGATPHQTATSLIRIFPRLDARLEEMIGKDDIPAYIPSDSAFRDTGSVDPVPYKILGVTPETSDLVIIFAYRAQVHSDPARGPLYLDALKEINALRGDVGELQIEMAMEQSKDLFSASEIHAALKRIGVTPDAYFETFFGRKEYESPDENHIVEGYNATREGIILRQGTESDLKEVRDAMHIIGKAHPSELLEATLMSTMEHKATYTFTEDEAYSHLGITKETDDATMCTAGSFWLSETMTSTQKDKIIAALRAIAEARNSDSLRKFIETGEVPLPITAQEEIPVSLDRPAGLQNIGNTCYLNSLLQYFFTIRELREIVLDFEKYQEDEVTEDLLQRKRVGGRQVTAREIERSKKFVRHLSTLFAQLIHSSVPSVRPELDLAYLALVSTKDEDQAISLTQASTSTMPGEGGAEGAAAFVLSTADDITMTDDAPSLVIDASAGGLAAAQSHPTEVVASPTSAGSPSVLGKRTSEHLDEDGMDVDSQSQSRVTVSPEKPKDNDMETVSTDLEEVTGSAQVDRQMGERTCTAEDTTGSASTSAAEVPNPSAGPSTEKAVPPPLPPRPEQNRKATAVTNSNMMFGKQNDVSEAMDNVIFQIEVALNDGKIAKAPGNANSNLSFIQSLFYGTSRQTLDFQQQVAEAQRTKEETFSYLLVDVASEGRDLYDGLDASFQSSQVEVEGKSVRRKDVITALPPILQIQLQRVQFDRKTSKVFKSNAYMPFPQTLKMSRYLAHDPQDPVATEKYQTTETLRHKIAQGRLRLVDLEQVDDKKQSAAQILRDTEDALQQAAAADYVNADMAAFTNELQCELKPEDGDIDVLKDLLVHAEAAEKDIVEAKADLQRWRSQLERVWEDDHDADYELSSVFIHLGAAGYGHYYLYQRALPSQSDRWLKFNDATVTDVPSSEVYADASSMTVTPYWLSYVKQSEIPSRVDAVCRQF